MVGVLKTFLTAMWLSEIYDNAEFVCEGQGGALIWPWRRMLNW